MTDVSFPEAYWCLDPIDFDHPADWVQGHATFRAGRGIDVELPLGTLPERKGSEGGVVYDDTPPAVDHIYGYNQKGSYQVISRVYETHRSATYPGMKRQTLHGDEMIVSKKAVAPNPLISTITFGMDGLREWVGVSPTRSRYKPNDGGGIDQLQFSYDSADVPDVVIHDADGVRIAIDFFWTSKGGYIPLFERSFVSDYKVSISFSEPIRLAVVRERWVKPLWDFLCFCMGFHGSLTSVSFVTTDGTKADYYAAFAEGKSPTPNDLRSMPLGWQAHSDRIDSMFNSWLGFEGYQKEAAVRAVSMLYDWKLPLELSFISVAQAFEAISRVGADPYDLDPAEFDRRLQEILFSISDGKLRKWAKGKMRYCNNKSANQLAQQELSELGAYADYIVPDRNRFLKDHRDTRNYNTHLDDTDKPNVLHGRELLANRDATFMLLYGSICMSMGLTPEEVLEAVKRSNFKSDYVHRARELYG